MEDLASLRQPKKQKPVSVRARWEKPEPGWLKVNTDAAFDKEGSVGRAGVIICDQAGLVIGGSARWFDDVPDALTAEAIAAKEGLELAAELGLEKVCLEVDCQGLSNLLQSPNSSISYVGGLCFDIIELSKSFREFKIKWVRRGANSVAHLCASFVSTTERLFLWTDCIPDWLVDLAAVDYNLAMEK
jgi:ribonuclease HI